MVPEEGLEVGTLQTQEEAVAVARVREGQGLGAGGDRGEGRREGYPVEEPVHLGREDYR